MKKQIIKIIVLFFLVGLPLSARTIEQFYITMPDILNSLMSKKQKTEILEYYKANMGDSIENRFNNQTHLLHLDTLNGYFKLKSTDVSTLEIKMFKCNGDTILGVIKTVCAPVCQSSIDFFDTHWNKTSSLVFKMPKALDWVSQDKLHESDFTMSDIAAILNVNFISLSFESDRDNIVATNNSLLFLDEPIRNSLISLLKEEKCIFHLDGIEWKIKQFYIPPKESIIY